MSSQPLSFSLIWSYNFKFMWLSPSLAHFFRLQICCPFVTWTFFFNFLFGFLSISKGKQLHKRSFRDPKLCYDNIYGVLWSFNHIWNMPLTLVINYNFSKLGRQIQFWLNYQMSGVIFSIYIKKCFPRIIHVNYHNI